MSEMTVDTRGLSCPEPVLLTKKALAQGADKYSILIDNPTALGNVSRFLKRSGKGFEVKEQAGEYIIEVG